ncbi:FecR family protein [Chryseobacterium lathyri]|uniref:FecR protein domain-containing protein n=1 Tax=Chryseobacterium lathyri TaxID=395933 RepID=A0A511Y7Q8_9FLAO|nr:FecR family protein [Chryseobacterium lathyri]GEN71226.1 hypothetical protein CLA01_12980 [Chryseobacterium lathyri]
MEDKFNLTEEEDNKAWTNAFITIRRKEQQKRKRRYIIFGGMAAVVLFSSSILGFNILNKPDVYFANSNRLKVLLPDNSEVILQKGAKLTVEKSFPADTRDVKLEGDAVFKVSKSKTHPFIVHGNDYETKVLGTVFKVSQNGKTFTVDLFEGKIQVNKNGTSEKPLILRPKETFSNMGSLDVGVVMKTESKNSPTQHNNKLIGIHFSECPVKTAIQTLERNYGLKISYPLEVSSENVSVAREDANATDIIKAIALQLNLNIKQINATTFELEK